MRKDLKDRVAEMISRHSGLTLVGLAATLGETTETVGRVIWAMKASGEAVSEVRAGAVFWSASRRAQEEEES